MEKPTGQIRHQIYDFIESKGIKLTPKDLEFLSQKISEHSENRIANIKDISRRFSLTQEKVSKYLKKARLTPKLFLKEIEVLERVSNWLNSDAE